MAFTRTVILLTGAPKTEHLDWTERLLNQESSFEHTGGSARRSASSSSPLAKWRILASTDTGSLPGPEETLFLSLNEIDYDNLINADSVDARTEAHILDSFATDASSNPSTDARCLDTTISFYLALSDTPLGEKATAAAENDETSKTVTHLAGSMTEIRDIPSAAYLRRMEPHTITVNLLVGVIEIRPTRTVTLRRSKLSMDIVEIVVGDDTRAGFCITVWLVPVTEYARSSRTAQLRMSIEALRAGDKLLLQDLALHSFRGCVFGQTLNSRVSRGTTIVSVESSTILPPHLHEKLKRLSNWIDQFVADKPSIRQADQKELLPPETQ